MSKRIVITGATGFIGSNITKLLSDRGDEVTVFTRNPARAEKVMPYASEYVEWNYDEAEGEWKEKLNGADAVIHLAGENIMAGRWTDKQKNKIYDSRIEGTKNLINAISDLPDKPESFICASGKDYYDNSIDKEFDETDEAGGSFLSKVTNDWESAAQGAEKLGVRRVSIRIGIVLDKNEGALAKMITPFKFFIGGPLGSGKQWMSWIHIDDLAGLFIYAVDNKDMKGVYNGVADNVTMNEFAGKLGKVLRRPGLFKVPSFILRIILGEAAELVLKGSKVVPRRTLESGYEFQYRHLEEALQDIIAED